MPGNQMITAFSFQKYSNTVFLYIEVFINIPHSMLKYNFLTHSYYLQVITTIALTACKYFFFLYSNWTFKLNLDRVFRFQGLEDHHRRRYSVFSVYFIWFYRSCKFQFYANTGLGLKYLFCRLQASFRERSYGPVNKV